MSIQQRIETMELLNKLMELFFKEDENNFVFDSYYSRSFLRLARYKCAIEDTKGAIEYLLKAEKYAMKFDNVMKKGQETYYKFILFNRCKIEPQKLVTNWEGSEIEALISQLDTPIFDVIRNTDEFISLHKRLTDFLKLNYNK